MIFFIFIIGTCFGSFIECMTQRTVIHESVYGRSHCDYCGHTLHTLDLIPIISYLFLKGKCRYCHHLLKISLLLNEITVGFLFVLLYLRVGFDLRSFILLVCFLYASKVDILIYEIPDISILISLSTLRLCYLKETICFIVLLVLFVYGFYKLFHKEGLGGGDIKLLMVICLSSGLDHTLMSLSLSCLFGLVYCLFKKKEMIPFGPFITLGWFLMTII